MCVILYNRSGERLNKKLLEIAYNNNPHGYGIMWVEQNRLNVIKAINDFDQIWQILKMLEGFQYSFHLRWRTAGDISNETCHPFQILDYEENGIDLALMHNGTLNLPYHAYKSDTQIFSELFKSKILEKDPKYKFQYMNKIEKSIGYVNKMVLMTSDNRTFILNKNLGTYIDNIWFSNTYTLKQNYRKDSIDKESRLYY